MAKYGVIAAISLLLAQAVSGEAIAGNAPGQRAVPRPGERLRDCPNCPEMMVVPAGTFVMGSPDAEAGRFKDEGPQHSVTISRPFAIGIYPVTLTEYRRFAVASGHAINDECRVLRGQRLVSTAGKNWLWPDFLQTDQDPVVCVTWDDAHAYIDWLNGQVKQNPTAAGASGRSGPYRLPSEAEWEYAARAGTTTPFYWGMTMRRSDANYGLDDVPVVDGKLVFKPMAQGADRWKYTSPVGAFPANPFGLYDMAGNAWQFVEDCWHPDYLGAPNDGSARTDGKCDERIVRGGSWLKPPAGERPAKRGEAKVDDLYGNHEIGFRVVRDLDRL